MQREGASAGPGEAGRRTAGERALVKVWQETVDGCGFTTRPISLTESTGSSRTARGPAVPSQHAQVHLFRSTSAHTSADPTLYLYDVAVVSTFQGCTLVDIICTHLHVQLPISKRALHWREVREFLSPDAYCPPHLRCDCGGHRTPGGELFSTGMIAPREIRTSSMGRCHRDRRQLTSRRSRDSQQYDEYNDC